jgi:hypothetical protein
MARRLQRCGRCHVPDLKDKLNEELLAFFKALTVNARYDRDLVESTTTNGGTTTDQFLTDVGTGRSRMNIY